MKISWTDNLSSKLDFALRSLRGSFHVTEPSRVKEREYIQGLILPVAVL